MTIDELMENINHLPIATDCDVYIRIGLQQVKISKVTHYPETDYEYEAIIFE